MTPLSTLTICYLALISFITIVTTCLDKLFAKKDMRRISEKTLILLAAFGGSFAEYVTMRLIRHKTLHRKFMIGLPLIIVLQTAVVFIFLYVKLKGTV